MAREPRRPQLPPRREISPLRLPLLVYVATLPLFWPSVEVMGKSLVAADVALVVLVSATLRNRRSALGRQPGLLWFVAVGPVLAMTASAWNAGAGWIDVLRIAYSVGILLLVAHLSLPDSDIEGAAWVWFLTALAITMAGLLAYTAGLISGVSSPLYTPFRGGLPRLSTTLYANALTPYLQCALALIGFLLARSWGSAGQQRVLRMSLMVLPVAAVLTVSRGLAGLLLVLALIAFGPERSGWLGRHRRLLALAAAGMLVAATVVSVWAVFPVRPLPGAPFLAINDGPSAYRLLHQAAFGMVLAHPVLGVGPDQFGEHLREFTTQEERDAAWPRLDPSLDWNPHSTWAGWAAQFGGFGMLSLAVLFGYVGWQLQRARRLERHGFATWAMIALLALGLTAIHVDLLHVKFPWVLIGLALGRRVSPDRRGRAPGR